MKKYLLFLVAAILATVARAAVGDTFTYQGLKFKVTSEDDHTVAVDKNENVSGDISIPSFAVNGSSRYFVTEIGWRAFNNCSSLTSVNIPTSVTKINSDAFSGCRSLTSVNIPTSVTEIEAGAFSFCSSLLEIGVENGNPNYNSEDGVLFNFNKTELIQCPGGKTGEYSIPASVNIIWRGAFTGCRSLTSVNIPTSVTEIEWGAFYGCSSLTSISIPNSVTEISEEAFNGCNRLISINIPNSVTKIKHSAFIACISLISINIPNSVTEIGYSAFYGCSSLTSVNIPTSVTKIEDDTFHDCSSLTSIYIPNSVTEIGVQAFYGCSSLTSITIPNSVTKIGEMAFHGCSSLASVTIPNSISEIELGTFMYCTGLKTIYDLNPTPQKIGENVFYRVPTDDVVVYVPKGSFKDYFVASGWTIFTDFREMGAFDVALSEQTLELTAGNTATITATVTKDDDVTVKSEEWSSSNPEVATVDNGVITAVAPGEAVIRFTAVDGYGLSHTEACKVTVSESAGVADVVTDADASVDVYNLQGVAVLRGAAASELGKLPAGLYIVRQGKSVKKIIVK